MDVPTARSAALIAAAAAHAGQGIAAADLITYASQLAPWILAATTRLVLTVAIDGTPVTLTTPPGGTVPTTVTATVDNNTVTLTAQPEDDHGDPTPDQLTWTNDDTAGTVATWSVSADTHTYTGTLKHAEGMVHVTVSDPSATGLAAGEVDVIVGPGATSQIVVTGAVS